MHALWHWVATLMEVEPCWIPTKQPRSVLRGAYLQAAAQQKESLEAQLDSYWTDLQPISLVAATWFIQMSHSFPAVPAADR